MSGRITALVLGASLLVLSSLAFADGRLQGRVVTGEAARNLEGAVVRIADLDRTVTTGRDGRFTFSQLPSGQHTLIVSYLGAVASSQQITIADNSTEVIEISIEGITEEIIVEGFRSGTASALNQQRASDTVTSVVSADAIGALPDNNVAEALQRVPGVFLERDQGEGRYIGIRGIDPNLNTTTINGLLVPAPDSSARSVALDVIPSDLLEGLEVTKTFTPDMDLSAVGGNVNVRALSAYDRGGRSLSFSAEGSYNELVEETSPKLAATWTDIFEVGGSADLGVAAAISWFDRDFGSDNIETDGGWPGDLETIGGQEFKGAEEIEQRSYSVNRERLGAALNFDLHTERGNYYWRNLYSDFSDQEFRTRNEYKFDDGTAVSAGDRSATWQDATVEKSMKDRLEEQTIISSIIGGENYFDLWTIDYSYGYSFSREKEPKRLDTTFAVEEVLIGYTDIGQKPELFASEPVFVAESFALDEFEWLDGEAEDEAHNVKFNVTRDLHGAYSGDVKFGLSYRAREKTYDADVEIYGGPDDTTLTPFEARPPRYGIGQFGPGINAGSVRSFFDQNRGSLELDEEDTLAASNVANYELNEDVTAAYLMSTFERGGWRVLYGVRYEDTDFDALGSRIVLDDVTGDGDPVVVPAPFEKSYDNWLPSVNVRWELGNLVFRGGASMTLARPNFAELSPGGEIELEEDDGAVELSAEIGNPELDPVESTNLDLGVEWYPGGVSVLSAGIFYKDIENFIVLAETSDLIDLEELVGVPVDDAEVIQPINGDNAKLLGIELAAVKQFENGWFISANGTYVDSEATYPGRSGKGMMPRTPEWVLNGAIGWESRMLGFRLAANYRDIALQGFEDLEDEEFDVFQDEFVQVDFSAKWNITQQWQLAFTATNLTDEPFYTYFGSKQYNAQFEEYGRTYSLGIKYTPFQ